MPPYLKRDALPPLDALLSVENPLEYCGCCLSSLRSSLCRKGRPLSIPYRDLRAFVAALLTLASGRQHLGGSNSGFSKKNIRGRRYVKCLCLVGHYTCYRLLCRGTMGSALGRARGHTTMAICGGDWASPCCSRYHYEPYRGGVVKASLCGRYPCPGICERVCHCPAGLERVDWLWLLRRGYRGRSEARTASPPPSPPSVNTSDTLNQPRQKRPPKFYRTHNDKQAAVPYTRNLKPFASAIILTALLAFMGIVVLLGIVFYGGDLAPSYEPPQIYFREW